MAPAKERAGRKKSLVKRGRQEVHRVGLWGREEEQGADPARNPMVREERMADWVQKLQIKEKYPGAQDLLQFLVFPFPSCN